MSTSRINIAIEGTRPSHSSYRVNNYFCNTTNKRDDAELELTELRYDLMPLYGPVHNAAGRRAPVFGER